MITVEFVRVHLGLAALAVQMCFVLHVKQMTLSNSE